MQNDKDRISVVFKTKTKKNEAKSKEEGRPIYDDIEVCEIRFAGDRQRVGVFPAHAFSNWRVSPEGSQEEITYAMRFPDQYRRFKENRQQVQEGTPLDELTFLTQSKRMELRALNIYTAETLASLDGPPLKTLGMGGRELKNQAQAYLDNARGSAGVTKLAAENAALRERLDFIEREMKAGKEELAALDDAALKDVIKEKTGAKPRGNPSHETLVRMASEAA